MNENYNGFPTAYQQPVYQPYQQSLTYPYPAQNSYIPRQAYQPTQQSYTQMQQTNNQMIWVQGEAGAKATNVAPGTTIPLWDSEAPVIYIKSVDMSGKPSMTIIDYTERDTSNQVTTQPDTQHEYATKEQIDTLNGQYSSIVDQLHALSGQVKDIENRIKPQQNNNARRGNK